MEFFKDKALTATQSHPELWKRYMDDTFVIQHTEHKD